MVIEILPSGLTTLITFGGSGGGGRGGFSGRGICSRVAWLPLPCVMPAGMAVGTQAVSSMVVPIRLAARKRGIIIGSAFSIKPRPWLGQPGRFNREGARGCPPARRGLVSEMAADRHRRVRAAYI